jgi:hypothetical protein
VKILWRAIEPIDFWLTYMKRSIFFAGVFFILFSGKAQEQIVNTIALSIKNGDAVSPPVTARGFITLRNGTREFNSSIELFPIVPDKDAEDSLEQRNKPLVLHLNGQFPVDNMDYMTTADNGKTYTMNISARINDSTKHFDLNFLLLIPREESLNPNGNLPRYSARMSFILDLPPEQFGLDIEPFAIKNTILIQAMDAIISKEQ